MAWCMARHIANLIKHSQDAVDLALIQRNDCTSGPVTGGGSDLGNSKLVAPCRDSCVADPLLSLIGCEVPHSKGGSSKLSRKPSFDFEELRPSASLVSPSKRRLVHSLEDRGLSEDLIFEMPAGGSANRLGVENFCDSNGCGKMY